MQRNSFKKCRLRRHTYRKCMLGSSKTIQAGLTQFKRQSYSRMHVCSSIFTWYVFSAPTYGGSNRSVQFRFLTRFSCRPLPAANL